MNQKSRLLVLDYPFVLALKKRDSFLYSLIGGNIEQHETAIQSIIREAKEEAGIELKKASIQFVKKITFKKGETEHQRNYFKLLDIKQKFRVNEVEKFVSIEWVDFFEHKKKFKKADQQIIKSIFAEEF